jgi:hypothetical protein
VFFWCLSLRVECFVCVSGVCLFWFFWFFCLFVTLGCVVVAANLLCFMFLVWDEGVFGVFRRGFLKEWS